MTDSMPHSSDEAHVTTTPEGDKRSAHLASVAVIDDTVQGLTAWNLEAGTCSHLASLATYVMQAVDLHPDAELCIRLVDIAEMTELHERWMGEPGPTDVLSFPMDELRPTTPGQVPLPGVLGDIVICPAAVHTDHALAAELELLVVHGMLHLIGLDHADPGEQQEMFALQDRILQGVRELAGPSTLDKDSRRPGWGLDGSG